MTELAVTQYFTYWRRIELGDREILEGLVAPEHHGPSPALARRIAEWDGYRYWQSAPEGRWLVLVHERTPPRERWWLHAALLLLTVVTTSIGGAAIWGVGGTWYRPGLAELRAGLPFALPLLAILFAHESGHYVTARRYRLNASPPYFIPFPSQWNILGTMGAFIRLRSPVFDRRTLFDIGIAGPIAGMVVAVPVLLAGLALSTPEPGGPSMMLSHQFLPFDGVFMFVGDSLLMWLGRELVGLHGPVLLHPVALAGWVGILITSLNLLPMAQFDGGHIAFAMFGRAQVWVARGFWLLLLLLGRFWLGWWVWAVLALVIGRGRLGHPSIIEPEREIDPRRTVVGWVGIAIFLLTFMPQPWAFR